MEEIGIFHLVQHEAQSFLCFCSCNEGSIRFHVTNACDSWSGDVALHGGNLSLDGPVSSDNRISRLKDAFESQTPALSVRDSEATLTFQDGQESLTLDLHKDPASEARERVRELVFGLAVRVRELEKRLREGAVSSAAAPLLGSPRKDIQTGRSPFAPEPSSGRRQAGSGVGQAAGKRKLPGESLINPGFIRKKTPTGVDFEDA
ncbi:protein PAXX [Zootoca vivipara]|uniref:protein PAXX n=1 Tax=Zootoca vivipara TaxID=8524 RepID=UPI00159049C0|nr:protein PAXX [Zootoca vivipara]